VQPLDQLLVVGVLAVEAEHGPRELREGVEELTLLQDPALDDGREEHHLGPVAGGTPADEGVEARQHVLEDRAPPEHSLHPHGHDQAVANEVVVETLRIVINGHGSAVPRGCPRRDAVSGS
jgi:hypothetical protein